MTRSLANAFKSVAVLVCISVVCIAALALCNMFFPKYVPVLDGETSSLINGICKTGVDDDRAYSEGYIVLLGEDEYGGLSDYNAENKDKKAELLAVYGVVAGDSAGAFVVESKSHGRDSDIVLLVAYRGDAIIGAVAKSGSKSESYWDKLPKDLFEKLEGKSGDVDLKTEMGKTGATISLSAIDRAVNLSNAFAIARGEKIVGAISERRAGND